MPPRRIPRRRVARVVAKGKVSRPLTLEAWNKLKAHAGHKLILVCFASDDGPSGHRIRTMMAELAGHKDYKCAVEFVMVDLGKAMILAESEGVRSGIVVGIYQNQKLIEKSQTLRIDFTGPQVMNYLNRHVGRVRAEIAEASKSRKRLFWLGGIVLGVMTIIGGAITYMLCNKEEEPEDILKDITSRYRPKKKRIDDKLQWADEEEDNEDANDHWAEYVDTDRDDFEPFQFVREGQEA